MCPHFLPLLSAVSVSTLPIMLATTDDNDSPMDSTNPDYWPTTYIAIVPRITGTLSIFSSSVIIYLIFRSADRLASIYHRIMFCMSICDILSSIGYVLGSWAMPAEMPMEKELGIYLPEPRYGNTLTCDVQGFLTLFGGFGMFGYNASLCLYYACAIGVEFKDKTITKFVQPVVLCLPIVVGLTISMIALCLGLNNPPTEFDAAWCISLPYPHNCLEDEEIPCLRGKAEHYHLILGISKILALSGVIIISTSMGLVVIRVIYLGRSLHADDSNRQEETNNPENSDSATGDDIDYFDYVDYRRRRRVNTAVIIVQAMAYVMVFILGLAWSFDDSTEYSRFLADFKFGLIFVPIQGFFNMIIFICHKIYNYRRVHEDKSRCETLQLLFTTSCEEPQFVSHISLVDDDNFQRAKTLMHMKVPALKGGNHSSLNDLSCQGNKSDNDNHSSTGNDTPDEKTKNEAKYGAQCAVCSVGAEKSINRSDGLSGLSIAKSDDLNGFSIDAGDKDMEGSSRGNSVFDSSMFSYSLFGGSRKSKE